MCGTSNFTLKKIIAYIFIVVLILYLYFHLKLISEQSKHLKEENELSFFVSIYPVKLAEKFESLTQTRPNCAVTHFIESDKNCNLYRDKNNFCDTLPSNSPILITMYHLELTPESYKL